MDNKISGDKALIAYCGLYCGGCSFKAASETGDMGHILAMPAKYDKYKKEPPGALACPGCRLENQCGACKIRDCAAGKKLLHCGECDIFPCKLLLDFNNDGQPHHALAVENLKALKSKGAECWLAEQKKMFTCACGARLSWYTDRCLKNH